MHGSISDSTTSSGMQDGTHSEGGRISVLITQRGTVVVATLILRNTICTEEMFVPARCVLRNTPRAVGRYRMHGPILHSATSFGAQDGTHSEGGRISTLITQRGSVLVVTLILRNTMWSNGMFIASVLMLWCAELSASGLCKSTDQIRIRRVDGFLHSCHKTY